jgi:Rrf2 family protein
MRRLGEGVEHALHCVMVMGALPDNAMLAAKALAEFHGVSESYLLKHLKALAAAGVVVSSTGKRGGYRLARPASETTFLDVVEAIDGPGPAFRCTEIRQRGPANVADPCAYKAPCLVHRRMMIAERAWRDALKSQTIADLVEAFDSEMDPRNLVAGTDWVRSHMNTPKTT